jgi:hypothetical protein
MGAYHRIMSKLRDILNASRTKSDATHTEMPDASGKHAGKYYIAGANKGAFMDAYIDALKQVRVQYCTGADSAPERIVHRSGYGVLQVRRGRSWSR